MPVVKGLKMGINIISLYIFYLYRYQSVKQGKDDVNAN